MRRIFFCFLTIIASYMPAWTLAHPISISDIFVEIQPGEIQVRAEVFVEDLYLFHDLKLAEPNILPLAEIEKGTTQHAAFLLERFKILNAAGEKLAGEIVRINTEDLPGRDIPQQHLMFFKIIYEIRYQVTELPQYLTFLQEFTHESVVLPAEVQLKLKPLYGRRKQQLLLPQQPWTVHLNNSAEAAEELEKLSPQQRFEAMREDALGITSYGQTYVFLYRDPHQIRLESLIPLATLAGELELDRPIDGLITVETQNQLRSRIAHQLTAGVKISRTNARETATVNESVPGQLQRIDFFGVSFRDFSRPAEAAPVSLANARIGVIVHYPLEQTEDGQLVWNLFNEFLYQLQLTVITDELTEQFTLRDIEQEKTFRWTGSQPESSPSDNGLTDSQRSLLAVTPPSGLQMREQMILAILMMMVATMVLFHFSSRSPRNRQRQSLVTILFSVVLLTFVGIFSRNEMGGQPPELLKPEQEKLLTSTLLQQVYSAFNQRDEQAILQELEQVVAGPLLRELYLEIRESMTIEEQGGALARTGNLELLSCGNRQTSAPADKTHAFQLEARWQVPGTVEHWGHIHSRKTEYLANLTFAPVPIPAAELAELEYATDTHRWKLTDISLLQQNQSVLETTVRKF